MLRQLISYPKIFFRSLDLRSQISKRIMWIISKSHREKIFFLIFLQSIHQVDMKNVDKCASDFFPYFETLYTNSVACSCPWIGRPTNQREIYGGNCIERKKQGSSHGTFSLPNAFFKMFKNIFFKIALELMADSDGGC